MKPIHMKNSIKLSVLVLAIISIQQVYAQDTLHLDFGNTQTVPDKAMEDKIVAWGKTLGGKKQDIKVRAYYHKADFKEFAQKRLDEMYLSINRKVRDLVNIKEQETKKGENYQRTRVDIIYWPAGTDEKSMAKDTKKDTKDTKKDTKDTKKDVAKDKKDTKTDDKKVVEEEKQDDTPKGNDGKVGKDAGKKKGDEGKTIKYDPAKEYLDSTYVNGVLKITKRKKK